MNNKQQNNGIAYFLTKNAFWLISFFVVVPFAFQVVSIVINLVKNGQFEASGDWLGFWGGYLGIIPSGLIAFYVSKSQILSERELQETSESDAARPIFVGMISWPYSSVMPGDDDPYKYECVVEVSVVGKESVSAPRFLTVYSAFYTDDNVEINEMYKSGSVRNTKHVSDSIHISSNKPFNKDHFKIIVIGQLADGRFVKSVIVNDGNKISSDHWIKNTQDEKWNKKYESSFIDENKLIE